MTVPGEGMPMYEDSDRFGDLHVEFTVKFPTTVTDEQKEGTCRLVCLFLPLRPSLSELRSTDGHRHTGFRKLLKKEKKDGSSSAAAESSTSDKTEL
jgi:DnaJ-class molecular chaperone